MTERKKFILALTTHESDYQVEDAAEAERVAKQLGIELKVLYAEGDAVTQSQQLLEAIQLSAEDRPQGVLVLPVGTSLRSVAQAAAQAGIGWVILSRGADYIQELRSAARTPVFEVVMDHVEIGRIQGRQIAALFAKGVVALCLEGPTMSPEAQQRKAGLLETKPPYVELRTVRSGWGRGHARSAVQSWLRLSIARQARIDLVVAQSDSLAMGARDAFEEIENPSDKQHWLSLPYLGCHGSKNTGRLWTDQGLLTATVRLPLMTGVAIRLLDGALKGRTVEASTVIVPESYPALASIRRKQ